MMAASGLDILSVSQGPRQDSLLFKFDSKLWRMIACQGLRVNVLLRVYVATSSETRMRTGSVKNG